jgi:butyryl-CoA dehydrogenase
MDFTLTEEQKLIQQGVREFCDKYVSPIADAVDQEPRFPAETVKKLGEQDWLGIPYPTEYGGAGADYLSYILVIEELSRACATTGFTLECHTSLAEFPLWKYGTEEQKQKYLTPLCKGEMLGSFALTEPGAGTDAASGTTMAVLDGNEWVLNGSKIFISNAPVAGVLSRSPDRKTPQ